VEELGHNALPVAARAEILAEVQKFLTTSGTAKKAEVKP
jgi:hypothetical protein